MPLVSADAFLEYNSAVSVHAFLNTYNVGLQLSIYLTAAHDTDLRISTHHKQSEWAKLGGCPKGRPRKQKTGGTAKRDKS
jgi:hypothetical protein